MRIEMPTTRRSDTKHLLAAVVGDKANEAIITYILARGQAHLGEISRELTRRGIASRRTIFERLVYLSDAGLLKSDMVQMELKGEVKPIKAWVKQYQIASLHKEWIQEILGTKEELRARPMFA